MPRKLLKIVFRKLWPFHQPSSLCILAPPVIGRVWFSACLFPRYCANVYSCILAFTWHALNFDAGNVALVCYRALLCKSVCLSTSLCRTAKGARWIFTIFIDQHWRGKGLQSPSRSNESDMLASMLCNEVLAKKLWRFPKSAIFLKRLSRSWLTKKIVMRDLRLLQVNREDLSLH